MNQRKVHSQCIGNICRSLSATGVRRDDDAILHSAVLGHDLVLDILSQQVAAVEIVDGDVEEALVLRVVQVHGDDVVGAGAGQEVGDEGAGLGDPLAVAALRAEIGRFFLVRMLLVSVMWR